MVLIDENDELKLLDQFLYEAYKNATEPPPPEWKDCSLATREAWAAVANAAAEWAAIENAPEE